MLPPPPTGNPYDYIDQNQRNAGSLGVLKAWDTLRWFWGGTAQQGWADLVRIEQISGNILV